MAAAGVQGHQEVSGGDGMDQWWEGWKAVTGSHTKPKKTYQDKMSTELSAELSATVDSHECDFLDCPTTAFICGQITHISKTHFYFMTFGTTFFIYFKFGATLWHLVLLGDIWIHLFFVTYFFQVCPSKYK